MVMNGLHYLHTQASIIHTDLKSDNILMALRDQSVLDTVARDELEDPLPQMKCEDRTIYLSRNAFGFQADSIGRPVLMDFGLSACGKTLYTHAIQPQGLRTPEVINGSGWDYSADIWNLGALTWELLCGTGPFDNTTSCSDCRFTEEKHLACIISLVGAPPKDMLKRGSQSSRYFNDDGIWFDVSSPGKLSCSFSDGSIQVSRPCSATRRI